MLRVDLHDEPPSGTVPDRVREITEGLGHLGAPATSTSPSSVGPDRRCRTSCRRRVMLSAAAGGEPIGATAITGRLKGYAFVLRWRRLLARCHWSRYAHGASRRIVHSCTSAKASTPLPCACQGGTI